MELPQNGWSKKWKVEKLDDEQGYPHDYGNLYIDGRCHGIKCIPSGKLT